MLSNLVNLVGRESELWPNLAKAVGWESERGPIWSQLTARRAHLAQFGQS